MGGASYPSRYASAHLGKHTSKRGSEESAQIFQSIDRLVLDAAVWNGLMVDIFRIYSTDMKDYREKEQIIWEEKNGVKDAYALEEDDEELQREADMVDGLPRFCAYSH